MERVEQALGGGAIATFLQKAAAATFDLIDLE